MALRCGYKCEALEGAEECEDFKNKADFAEVKHGYWIKVGKTEGRANILQCSVCGKVRRGIAKTPYCKDCGAKMDEREDKQHDNN